MNYFPDAFAHPPYQAMPQPMYYQQSQYGTYMQPHQRPLDEFYPPYSHYEYADFLPPGMLYEDFEENGEASSRPRLTKEQVEVLEAQFQAHPKPNSMVKRQLAMQTKLTLPRVANWFQNRRAKAKQQRKQEEFEISQALQGIPNSNAGKEGEASSMASHAEIAMTKPNPAIKTPSPLKLADSNASTPIPRSEQSKEASWLSLQRALTAAKAAQQPSNTPQRSQTSTLMPPPELPAQTMQLQLPIRNAQALPPATTHFSNWDTKQADLDLWSPPAKLRDVPFDFGFTDHDLSSATGLHESIEGTSPSTMAGQEFIVSPSAWDDALETPKVNYQAPFEPDQMPQLPHTSPLADHLYLSSRRTSTTEGLSSTLDNFAFLGSSPNSMVPASLSHAPQDTQLDIAARRKRPRPAALTSSALRSRSFGQLSSTTTHSRSAITPPAASSIRHVKSTSHSLNQRYAGIRKASSAQRSPMNIATFAEAEAFNKLMAQQAAMNVSHHHSSMLGSNDKSPPVVSPEGILQPHPRLAEAATFKPDQLDLASRYQLPATQHLTLTTSPPSTPFVTDFLGPTLAPSPLHAHAGGSQFACFPEYTPPYSAGPLTSSSWSDAPLTSPELPNFPPASYLSSMNFPTPTDTRFNFQQYLVSPVLRSDTFPVGESRKTEFCIQEFPNQKEEHAHVAQQLAQQKPKSYVFANSAPSDFD